MLKILVPAAFVLATLAVPAMAQDYYGRYDRSVPITGAQMSDYPSSRANVTMTGSFLRPNVPDHFVPVDQPVRHRHHYRDRRYDERYNDYRYDEMR